MSPEEVIRVEGDLIVPELLNLFNDPVDSKEKDEFVRMFFRSQGERLNRQ